MSVLCLSIFFCTYHDTHSTPLQNAVGGTLNVIRQAADAGHQAYFFHWIHRCPSQNLARSLFIKAPQLQIKDWNPFRRGTSIHIPPHPSDDAILLGVQEVCGSQTLWKLVDEYPDLNLTTGKPPSVSSCADPPRTVFLLNSVSPTVWLLDRTPKSTS